ncbi:cysteine-rich receptor-like protein kinase 10 isoform X2 [Vigna radiata var. radiata]|uniref:Cysteine-rich receptor-like protein kinase 10 isoform X2 n=1 Tax=Vigna radiata var. radiata TaxID=3916 RepID=A0A3Q0FC72_VIGRR|nr:cysteine-rich receptor-like protein kinase 10 isoform X2 [Vigna radiata var. radiata]
MALFSLKHALFFMFLIFTTVHASDDPIFLRQNCTTNETFTPNTTFQVNLRTLLSSLSSLATRNTQFRNATVSGGSPSDSVYGLFLCRGDVPPQLCQQCVLNATQRLGNQNTDTCKFSKSAIVWYDECLVRYSNRDFFSTVETRPRMRLRNTANISDTKSFLRLLYTTLNETADEAANSSNGAKLYATKQANISGFQTLYCLTQCTPDLSPQDCRRCLSDVIGDLSWCCPGSQGGRVLYPSCNFRYELYPFYRMDSPAPEANVSPTTSTIKNGKNNISIILAIAVPIVVAVLLFIVGVCFLRKRASYKYNNSFGQDSIVEGLSDGDSLQFDLATIEAATNRFSDENKIGKGGFGVVYKGVLPDGQEIAVKRLSVTSLQGAVEFRNEAALVAKLQHRNLVRLLGFCLEGQEKILIYEYIPNKSLDYFLFNSMKQRELDWSQRYKIIVGIARGILYIHEDSQLRIVHRDLKASNVLLDENMNPKISDFGMAKIFQADQTQVNTGRIVGTYGYMSPEYAMRGQFSMKSDVFSFGVLVLEIVSGKKNTDFYQSNHADDLLIFAWKKWTEQTPMEFVDPTLRGSCSRNEVNRCIHIGLLCVQENPSDRPSMSTIALMLNSYSVTMSMPRQPASFLRGRNHNRLNRELDSDQSTTDQSTSCSIPYSVNEVSITEVYPR